MTRPKTTCLLSRKGVGTVVMKNWQPFVFGPEFCGNVRLFSGVDLECPCFVLGVFFWRATLCYMDAAQVVYWLCSIRETRQEEVKRVLNLVEMA